MPTEIQMTAEIERQVQLIDETSTEFSRTNLTEVTLADALAPLIASVEGLRVLLPEIATQADAFFNTEDYVDSEDYSKVYEGISLLAMYVMMNALSLASAKDFSDYRRALGEMDDDLGALVSYCSGWDWEHGVWFEPLLVNA